MSGEEGTEISWVDLVGPYEPRIVALDDAGLNEFVLFDRATIHEDTDAGYQIIRDMETRAIIGFAWPISCPPERPHSPTPSSPSEAEELAKRTTHLEFVATLFNKCCDGKYWFDKPCSQPTQRRKRVTDLHSLLERVEELLARHERARDPSANIRTVYETEEILEILSTLLKSLIAKEEAKGC